MTRTPPPPNAPEPPLSVGEVGSLPVIDKMSVPLRSSATVATTNKISLDTHTIYEPAGARRADIFDALGETRGKCGVERRQTQTHLRLT